MLDPSVVTLPALRQRVLNPLDDLTERERDVLSVMAEGRPNQAICKRLRLRPKTVVAQVREVLSKLWLYQVPDEIVHSPAD